MGFCNCSMFCCALHYVHSNFATILMGKRELVALLSLPRSAVGNVFGNRCESDCRSRGCEFDPGPVPYFRGD